MQASLSALSIDTFLLCQTPQSWIEKALKNIPLLLIDHAHCERKAALSAISLMNSYPEKEHLLLGLSQLAREELRHFEKVISLLKARHIRFKHLKASRYALSLFSKVREAEPSRLIDKLIIGGIIEARSSERFSSLLPYLDAELTLFYKQLVKSETRHFLTYLEYAKHISTSPIDERINFFLEIDKALIESPEDTFRFHSGA